MNVYLRNLHLTNITQMEHINSSEMLLVIRVVVVAAVFLIIIIISIFFSSASKKSYDWEVNVHKNKLITKYITEEFLLSHARYAYVNKWGCSYVQSFNFFTFFRSPNAF